MNTKRIKLHLQIFLIYIIFAIVLFVIIPLLRPRLIGGELFEADFKNGYNLYIEESYIQLLRQGIFEETSHSIWMITDEYLKHEVFELCKEIENYRELEVVYDIMFGTPSKLDYYPRIYLDTGSFCYSIEVVNWYNFAGDPWAWYPIRNECLNEPVLTIRRIDLSEKTETKDSYLFARTYFGPDSVNRYGGSGWYSTLSQKNLENLLSLSSSVSIENALIVWSSVND